MEEDMWHQPEDARSVNSRLDAQSIGSRSNVGTRRRRQHQSPHHSLSRAFGEHVRRALAEQDASRHSGGAGDGELRRRHRRRRRHEEEDEEEERPRRREGRFVRCFVAETQISTASKSRNYPPTLSLTG